MRRMLPVTLMLLNVAKVAVVYAQAPLATVRASLDQARAAQDDVLKVLTDLQAERQRSASTTELMDTLEAVRQMQVATMHSTRTMLARTLGRSMTELAGPDRYAIEQLVVDQRAIRRRWTEWLSAFGRYASGGDALEAWRRLADRAKSASIGAWMEQAATEIGQNRLSQAATTGEKAADELARLRQALEIAEKTGAKQAGTPLPGVPPEQQRPDIRGTMPAGTVGEGGAGVDVSAMELLENAWHTMAQAMTMPSEGQRADNAEKNDQQQGQQKMREGSGSVAAVGRTQDDQPWYWDLPPQARDAIQQSLAEPMPPKYEPAIKRYYERLSHRRQGGR